MASSASNRSAIKELILVTPAPVYRRLARPPATALLDAKCWWSYTSEQGLEASQGRWPGQEYKRDIYRKVILSGCTRQVTCHFEKCGAIIHL